MWLFPNILQVTYIPKTHFLFSVTLFHRDMQMFEESFSYSCPKFISPVPPNFDAPPANFNRVS